MPKLVAIDLGSHAVKATVWEGTSRRAQFEGRYAARVQQEGGAAPSISARIAALEALLSAHTQWTGGTATIAVAWPGELATLHPITLPFADRAQVEKTLPFAVEAEVPFDMEEMVLASRISAGGLAGEQTKALVALVRKESLESLLGAMAAKSADPRNVFVEGDALGAWSPRERVCAVIDVGHAHTTLSVARDGVVQYSRAVNVGGRDMTWAIVQALQIPWDDAERLKHGERAGEGPGMLSSAEAWAQLPPKARDALDAPIGLLLAEIRSTLIAAEDVLGVEIEEVRLTGGGSRLHPLADYLRDDLRVPVESILDAEGEPVPAEYAVADALQLRLNGVTRGTEIDLRVGDLAYRGGTDLVRAVFVYGVPLTVFVLVASVVIYAVQYRSLSNEQAEVDQRLKDLVVQTFGVDPSVVRDGTTAQAIAKEKVTEALARAEALDRSSGTPPTVQALHDLTKAFPPNGTEEGQAVVDVNELSITPETISFTAETDGYAGAATVEETLQRNPRFQGAAKGNEKKTRDKVSFSISIPLDGAAAAPAGEEG